MTVTVSGHTLAGTATAPASKSVLHRQLICAALADCPTVIEGITLSQDIQATVDCLRSLGASIALEDTRLSVIPISAATPAAVLNCGESGSTLRFLLPIAAAFGSAQFIGRGRLAQRPLSPLYELLCENGCTLSPQGAFPLMLHGRLTRNRFVINGGVSSQFISGLLLAAPLLKREVTVEVTGTVESRPYIDLTLAAMRSFGVAVAETGTVFTVPAGSRYRSPGTVTTEGDWSNGAFWLVAGAIAADSALTVAGLNSQSLQGDRAIAALLRQAGLTLTQTPAGLSLSGVPTHPLVVDASQIPDLVPILAVLAAGIPGRSVIGNARRLRLKESDRLTSVCAMITALGGTAKTDADSLTIDGTGCLRGGTVDACNDHRIAMAAAVAACLCEMPVTITGAQAVQKSYPCFYKELAERGMTLCHQ